MNTVVRNLPSIDLPDLPSVDLPSVDVIDIVDTDAIADRAVRSWRWFARSVPFLPDSRRRRYRRLAAVGVVVAAILVVATLLRRRSGTDSSVDGSTASTSAPAGESASDGARGRPVSAVA